jgi:hypothetical protein
MCTAHDVHAFARVLRSVMVSIMAQQLLLLTAGYNVENFSGSEILLSLLPLSGPALQVTCVVAQRNHWYLRYVGKVWLQEALQVVLNVLFKHLLSKLAVCAGSRCSMVLASWQQQRINPDTTRHFGKNASCGPLNCISATKVRQATLPAQLHLPQQKCMQAKKGSVKVLRLLQLHCKNGKPA